MYTNCHYYYSCYIVESNDGSEDSGGDDDDDDDDDCDDCDDEGSEGGGGGLPSVDVISNHMNDIQAANDDDAEESEAGPDSSDNTMVADAVQVENFFDSGASSDAYDCFKDMLRCANIDDVSFVALKVLQLLQLGKLEKGAVTTSSKYKSLKERWFSQKAKESLPDDAGEVENGGADLFIQRDSLIQLNCKRSRSSSVENYRVLAFFTKFHNKWYLATEDKFLWTADPSKMKNVRVLARLMKKSGSSYGEVALEAGGDWAPQQVYRIEHFRDILKVENELLEM